MTEVSVPTTHRWIPKGMTVEYLKKTATDLVAIAAPVLFYGKSGAQRARSGHIPMASRMRRTQLAKRQERLA